MDTPRVHVASRGRNFLLVFLFVWLVWLVDQEQRFLMKHGLISKSFSRHLERMEKGMVLKMVLGATVLLGMMALTLIVLRYVLGLPV